MPTLHDPAACVNAALHYAARFGWRVLPVHGIRGDGGCTCGRSTCSSPGKHPRLSRWPELASTDPDTIRRWLSWWPTSNIGVATGDGLLVLDVDGAVGLDTIADLERTHGIPDTPIALTGGGGRHYFFRVDRPVGNKVGICRGVDIRGAHGFAVAVPSMHASGRAYTWDAGAHFEDVPVAPAPRWLLDLISTASSRTNATAGEELHLEPGERNHRLFRLVCSWRRHGIGQAVLLKMLEAVNDQHCHPPLDAGELAAIAASAAKYRSAPDDDGAVDLQLLRALGVR